MSQPSTIQPPASFRQNVVYYPKLYIVKALFAYLNYRQRLPFDQQPKIIRYPYNESLASRLFVPSTVDADTRTAPLFITIHGGGWALSSPDGDDDNSRMLSERFGMVVLSINYRKAPAYPFPTPVYDCAALIQAALDDPELPVDKEKVVVSGYSAGGNLALAAVQLRGIAKRIKAVVAYYPLTDFVASNETKLKSTVFAPGKETDQLEPLLDMFTWAYVPAGTDRQDPLLSPIFCERKDLPKNLFFLGCEYDVLCDEAHRTALKLAGRPQDDAIDHDAWAEDHVAWRLIKGVQHAFNSLRESDHELERARLEKMLEMHGYVYDWLQNVAFA